MKITGVVFSAASAVKVKAAGISRGSWEAWESWNTASPLKAAGREGSAAPAGPARTLANGWLNGWSCWILPAKKEA